MASRKRTSTLEIAEEIRVELGEASAVVPLGERRFLVADDEGGVRLIVANGAKATSTVLIDAGDDDRVAGLEGMCLADGRVLAVREGDGGVVAFSVPAAKAKRVQLEALAELVRPPSSPGKKNKGYEGMAFLGAGAAFDGKDHVVAVHEGKPRAVCVFAWTSLTLEHTVAIDDANSAIAAALPDLSDVAVHPKTGELWLLSDEGECVVRVKLVKGTNAPSLVHVATHALPVEDGEKPEGIAFDEDGALWLVTDDSGRLIRLAT